MSSLVEYDSEMAHVKYRRCLWYDWELKNELKEKLHMARFNFTSDVFKLTPQNDLDRNIYKMQLVLQPSVKMQFYNLNFRVLQATSPTLAIVSTFDSGFSPYFKDKQVGEESNYSVVYLHNAHADMVAQTFTGVSFYLDLMKMPMVIRVRIVHLTKAQEAVWLGKTMTNDFNFFPYLERRGAINHYFNESLITMRHSLMLFGSSADSGALAVDWRQLYLNCIANKSAPPLLSPTVGTIPIIDVTQNVIYEVDITVIKMSFEAIYQGIGLPWNDPNLPHPISIIYSSHQSIELYLEYAYCQKLSYPNIKRLFGEPATGQSIDIDLLFGLINVCKQVSCAPLDDHKLGCFVAYVATTMLPTRIYKNIYEILDVYRNAHLCDMSNLVARMESLLYMFAGAKNQILLSNPTFQYMYENEPKSRALLEQILFRAKKEIYFFGQCSIYKFCDHFSMLIDK